MTTERDNKPFNFWREFENSTLSAKLPIAPHRGTVLAESKILESIFSSRPDIRATFNSLSPREQREYSALVYKFSTLSREDFLALLNDNSTSLRELVWRQRSKLLLSKGHKVIPDIRRIIGTDPLKVYSYSIFAEHFDEHDKVVDTRTAYDPFGPESFVDNFMNALLAYKLVTDKSFQHNASNLHILKEHTQRNGLDLNIKALYGGFLLLVDEKIFKDLSSVNTGSNFDIDIFFSRVASWLSELALERSRNPGTFTNPYPLGIIHQVEKKFPGTKTEENWPTILYLPEMVASFISYAESIPAVAESGKKFPADKIFYMPGKVYEHVRDVLMNYITTRGGFSNEQIDELLKAAPKYNPSQSFENQKINLFTKPLMQALKLLSGSNLSEQTRIRIEEDVVTIGNYCLLMADEYHKSINELRHKPQLWDRRNLPATIPSPMPTYHDIFDRITLLGGQVNRSRKAAFERFRLSTQRGEDF